MKKITLDEFMEFGPCYSKEKIKKLMGRRKYLTAKNILMSDIPSVDKLWAVLREEFIDASILHEFACLCAEEALKMGDNPDPRSVEAIKIKRLWIKGEATDEELAAAGAAARAAAWAAAGAAGDAAWAAGAAARAAARAAAWAAARAAAWAAARAAAWAAGDAAWAAGAAARAAAWAAAGAAGDAAGAAARAAARAAAWAAQVKLLIDMLTN